MDWKVLIFIFVIIFFFWINHKYNNFFVRIYNNVSRLPKLIMVVVVIMGIFMPVLLKDNKFLNYFRDYLPDPVGRKLDEINGPAFTHPQFLDNKLTGFINPLSGGRGNKRQITTRSMRNVSEQVKKYVASQQQWKCAKCNALLDATYEIDHIQALEDGGDNNISNLQAVCRNCHGKKTMISNINRRYPKGMIN